MNENRKNIKQKTLFRVITAKLLTGFSKSMIIILNIYFAPMNLQAEIIRE